MRITTTSLAALLISLCAGQANAAEAFSPAYIKQVDIAAFSQIRTADIVKPAMEVAQALSALRPANGNLALVWQEGVGNNGTIVQNGSGNVGLIRQIGADNTASIRQSGTGHQALIVQQGRGNSAFIAQR